MVKDENKCIINGFTICFIICHSNANTCRASSINVNGTVSNLSKKQYCKISLYKQVNSRQNKDKTKSKSKMNTQKEQFTLVFF